MSAVTGWMLAAALMGVATAAYGWQGALAAISAIVFWLLLQFSRSMRTMRKAGERPIGAIGSAVMLNARLRPGLTMLQVIQMTGSIGRKLDATGDRWDWTDAGGSRVEAEFRGGKLVRHALDRSADLPGEAPAEPPVEPPPAA